MARNEIGEYINLTPKSQLIKRALWNVVCLLMFRPFPTKIFRRWRNFVLRLFGAKIGPLSGVYSSVTITCPWNLELKQNAWIGPHAICDTADKLTVGDNATISQYAYICTDGHDIYHRHHDLITAPIMICANSWVAAGAFVGMGVTIGEGAVVGARAAVFKDVEPWTVVGGNPAKFIKKREFKD